MVFRQPLPPGGFVALGLLVLGARILGVGFCAPPCGGFLRRGSRTGARGQDQGSRGCEDKACPEPVEGPALSLPKGTKHRVAPAVIRLELQADADDEVEHAFALDFALRACVGLDKFAFGLGGRVARASRLR